MVFMRDDKEVEFYGYLFFKLGLPVLYLRVSCYSSDSLCVDLCFLDFLFLFGNAEINSGVAHDCLGEFPK